MKTTAFIGLGSNLDNPVQQIKQAFTELNTEHTRLTQQSSLFRSKPVGPAGQDHYINAAAEITTLLAPLELLDFLQAIESSHKRVRAEHWGPRTLDLDLLLYGQQSIDCSRLKVPHAYLSQRNFVLYPLLEIAPELCLPSGRRLDSFEMANDPTGLEKL